MSFYDNLNRICKEKGTSPTRLCIDLGVSTSKVTAWHRGSLPKAEIMQQLALKLGCSVSDFFKNEGIGNESVEVSATSCVRPEYTSKVSTILRVFEDGTLTVAEAVKILHICETVIRSC